MSRRARQRKDARPWEQEPDTGDWSYGTGEGEEDEDDEPSDD